jgi:hypothetical protein
VQSEQEPRDQGRKDAEVDVQRLADRVYRLMVEELRIERSRDGRLDH